MKEIINKARKFALEEINKNGSPSVLNLELSASKGLFLARELKANENIVLLGCYLMDIKLGEAKKLGKLPEHTQMGSRAAKKFLEDNKFDQVSKDKIINCVEAHHGTKKFTCLEAEICANADCYRFIHPKGFFAYLSFLGRDYDTFEECLSQAEKKMDEKHQILSLDICKRELEPFYSEFKGLIKEARSIQKNVDQTK